MVAGLLLVAAALVSVDANPVSAAIERYQTVESYQVTLRSSSGSTESEVIHYHYKKPGFVRMEFVQPFKGAVLVYSPSTKEVSLRPFGALRVPVFTLSPGNRLARSAGGHRVDRSDVGALLQNVKALQEHGATEVLGEEPADGRQAIHVAIIGRDNFSVEGVHRYDLWLETSTLWPLKATSHDVKNALIETVVMDDLQINPTFPDDFFNP